MAGKPGNSVKWKGKLEIVSNGREGWEIVSNGREGREIVSNGRGG